MIHLCDCRDCMEFSYGAPMCEDCAAAGCNPSGESECIAFVLYGGGPGGGRGIGHVLRRDAVASQRGSVVGLVET